jgi:methionine synthase II (cobalamin-independent)
VSEQGYPWPAGAATGVGSLPGTDPGEALRVVFGELPDLPYLPELPDRGPGAELLGRTAGLLAELPVELYAARWRIAARPGRDLRRTRDLLERDLDQLVEVAEGYTGTLKVAVGGPYTLAAGLELPSGGALLRDAGALRDLTASLAEGIAAHVADVAARVPGARVLLQVDEPSLPAVLAGRVRTESGLGTYRPVDGPDATETLRTVLAAAGVPALVHCCAADVPVGLLRAAGAAAVAVDTALLPSDAAGLDAWGEALDAGLGLFAGAVPASASRGADAAAADAVREFWHRLGLPPARLPAQLVLTQACGLVGAGPEQARAALRYARVAARRIADEPDVR